MRLFFILVLTTLIVACNNNTSNNNCQPVKKLPGERKNLNISIFLDLSDRISPKTFPKTSMEYWERDLGYISSISEAYYNHIRNKKLNFINDRIQLFCQPTDGIPKVDEIRRKLDKPFSKANADLDNICSIIQDYQSETKVLYEGVLSLRESSVNGRKNDYPGSDIYDFFKSKVKDYCVKENHRNILFILTDGYMFISGANIKNSENKSTHILSSHLKDWGFNKNNYKSKIENEGYAFQVPVTGLENLEVFVIGIRPENNWELDVLNTYWSNWLKEMGVKNFQDDNWGRYLKQADLPSEVDNLIQDFIHN